MFSQYFLMNPVLWIIPWILQSIAYYFLLKKMGLRRRAAIVPVWGDHEFSTVLFRRTRTFWRPFVIALVFTIGAYYLGAGDPTGQVYMIIANFVYGIFLIRMYHRIAKSFGRGIPYTILTVLFPTLFLLILGLGKRQYTPLQFKPEKERSRAAMNVRRAAIVVVSAVEILALVVGVGFWTVKTYPPKPLAKMILNDTYDKSKDIQANGKCVTRKDSMGEDAAKLKDMPVSRDKMFPDHSGDQNVVVMEYVIGSNLEKLVGMATANIRMMQDATKKGDGLTFVLEAGGSQRWFTSGIADGSYGRYTVRDGNVEKITDRNIGTMESPAELQDFIEWTMKKYPADRYMLYLWDHGGGLPYGYGIDDLNHRTDADGREGFLVSEIADSVRASGVKLDVIGFDACLMQDIEAARAFEPFADYYLASEETEGGFGWYYTSAFGKLAQDPGLPTEDFGRDMVSAYDQFNRIINDGKPNPGMTLSFVDLTRVKPAYQRVTNLFEKADAAIRSDSKDFAELGLAAMNAYSFEADMQIDLIDFLNKLGHTDVNDSICTQAEREAAINAVKACIVFRNKDSGEGIHGMALSLPYETIACYSDTHAELENLGLKKQEKLFNDIFSIIAVQKKAEHKQKLKSSKNDFTTFLENFSYQDYTKDDWYVKGFEDYEPTATLVDIPIKETKNGWEVQLPEKTWDVVADCRTSVYQETQNGNLRFLGNDHIGGTDSKGHPTVFMDDLWLHVNGRLIYYNANPVKETKKGLVFSGDTKARLNGTEDIIVHLEWDPVPEDLDQPTAAGHITGYDLADDEHSFMNKGSRTLEAGDSIQFLFDYYDKNGEFVGTKPYGNNIRISKMSSLKVEDMPLDKGNYQFLGILTDVYQRDLMTEIVDAQLSE
ncbi:MAG: clostripain-related cysteine peptidase [Bacillota bacterium]|nr:clostripain-related cysteine peptidase [Bacillota bacterium]